MRSPLAGRFARWARETAARATVTAYEARFDRLEGRATWLQNRAAGRDFHCGNPPAEQHHQPIAVSAAQDAGILRQRRDDVVY
jgi:hypothetical protein